MKKFLSLLTVALMVFTISVPEAEARRMGGGRSLGKTHRTAPSQQAQPRQTDTVRQQNAAPQRRGMMGGLLGGLLAGGLLAALFGGAFNGIQMMDMLIIGLLIWMAMRFLKMRRPQAATQGYQQARQAQSNPWQTDNTQQPQSASSGGFAQSTANDVPFNFPADFQMAAFLSGAREHYRILQGAWNHNDLDTMAEYMSADLLSELKAERQSLTVSPQTEVMYVDAEIVRADHDHSLAQISLKYTGKVLDKGDGSEEEITDIWHLERDLLSTNAPWLIVGIEGS